MVDLAWQITAAASLLLAIPVGLAGRRLLARLDERRAPRR
jgi:hypothetical protein